MESALTANDSEVLYLTNDGNIDFYTNCQNGSSSAVHTYIDTKGTFSGTAKSTYTLTISHGNEIRFNNNSSASSL